MLPTTIESVLFDLQHFGPSLDVRRAHSSLSEATWLGYLNKGSATWAVGLRVPESATPEVLHFAGGHHYRIGTRQTRSGHGRRGMSRSTGCGSGPDGHPGRRGDAPACVPIRVRSRCVSIGAVVLLGTRLRARSGLLTVGLGARTVLLTARLGARAVLLATRLHTPGSLLPAQFGTTLLP